MINSRAIRRCVPLFLGIVVCAGGCTNLRLPAIDPSGNRIFLPAPNYTSVTGPLQGLRNQRSAPAWQTPTPPPLFGRGAGAPAISPYSINTPVDPFPAPGFGPPLGPAIPPIYGAPNPLPNALQPPTGWVPVPQVTGPQVAPQLQTAPQLPVAPRPQVPAFGRSTFPGLTQPFNPALAQPLPPRGPSGLSNTQLSGSTVSDIRGAGIPGQLTVTPHRIVAPVGEEVLLTAQICGADGYMVSNQPIEWNLSPDSVGSIVEVDQNNKRLWRRLFGRPPYRRDGIFAKGLTSRIAQIIPRGLPGPQDDVTLSAGQTWTSISSSIEGATQVTCVAPRLEGWENRRSTATIHWVDGQWNFPPPTISNVNSGTTLCTQLRRTTNAAPLAGWRVVYEIVGGIPATFDGGRTRVEATSDARGRACVNVMPSQGQSGATQIRMQVIKTGSSSSDPSLIPLGTGMTTVSWTPDGPSSAPTYQPPFQPVNPGVPSTPSDPEDSADPTYQPPITLTPPDNSTPEIPDLSQPEDPSPTEPNPPSPGSPLLQIAASGPPTAKVGQQVDYLFTVRNPDATAAQSVEVRTNAPDGMSIIGTNPPATNMFGDQVIWKLGDLGPGQSRDVSVRYGIDKGGSYEHCVAAAWLSGGPVDDCVTTDVLVNGLSMSVRGDESAIVGDRVVFDITVRNISNRPLSGIVVQDDFDDGLLHSSGASPIRLPVGSLEPGREYSHRVSFEVRGEGRLCQRFSVTSDDGSYDEEAPVCIQAGRGGGSLGQMPPNPGVRPILAGPPAFQVQKIGPPELKVGDVETYKIQITNTGKIPLTDVQVFNDYDSNLRPLRASFGIERDGQADRIFWRIPRIEVGRTAEIIIVAQAMAPAPKACDRVTVMTREGVTETDDLCVQIYGVNAGPPPANFPPSGGGPGYIPPASINANKPTAESKPTTAKKPVEPVDDGIEVAITSMGSDGINTGNVTYYVEVTNTQDIVENNVVLTIETPEGTTFQTAISPPLIRPSRYASDKRTVEFLPIATLRANEKARFRIVAKRSGGKISRFRAKITSDRISHSPVFSDKTD